VDIEAIRESNETERWTTQERQWYVRVLFAEIDRLNGQIADALWQKRQAEKECVSDRQELLGWHAEATRLTALVKVCEEALEDETLRCQWHRPMDDNCQNPFTRDQLCRPGANCDTWSAIAAIRGEAG
jgi:hypothetical protein